MANNIKKSLSKSTLKMLPILLFAAFLLTGCISETINRTDSSVPFESFLQYSLEEYEIVQTRRVSRTTWRNTSWFIERIRIRGTEWTLTYTEHTGQERRLVFDNLYSTDFNSARGTFTNMVLQHAETTIEAQASELLSEHFTDREICDFSISIEIERDELPSRRFNSRESNLIDPEVGISLVNLTPQELFSFHEYYNVIIDTRVSTEDLRESPELRARFEDLLYDAIIYFEDESLVLSWGNITMLRYNAGSGEFVWDARLRFD